MAFSITLPARSKAHRIRLAQDGAEPDFSISKLIAWASANLNRDELTDLIEDLRALVDKAEDDLPKNALGEDSRRATNAKSFHGRYPEARAIRREG
jgi:hypothetical protein